MHCFSKLAIRTRLVCSKSHRSNIRKADRVSKLWVVVIVRNMIDLAYTLFCSAVDFAVVSVAEQTWLCVSDGLQIAMLFGIACPHPITNEAWHHIRFFIVGRRVNSRMRRFIDLRLGRVGLFLSIDVCSLLLRISIALTCEARPATMSSYAVSEMS
jgi:hypothetical protein